MKTLPPDPVIDEIREVRRSISARFDHDPKRLVDYYIQLQDKYKDRLLGAPRDVKDVDSSGVHRESHLR